MVICRYFPLSDFFHIFPWPLLADIFEEDEARDDLYSADREENLEDEDKAAVVTDSNSESILSLFPEHGTFLESFQFSLSLIVYIHFTSNNLLLNIVGVTVVSV